MDPDMTSADEAGRIASDFTMEGDHSQEQPQENTSVDTQWPALDAFKIILSISDATSNYYLSKKTMEDIGK